MLRAGLTSASMELLCKVLAGEASIQEHLRVLKLGPVVSRQPESQPLAEEEPGFSTAALTSLCNLMKSLRRPLLVMVWGLSGPQQETLSEAAVSVHLQRRDCPDGSLRLEGNPE